MGGNFPAGKREGLGLESGRVGMDGHLSSFPRDRRRGAVFPSGRVGISQGRPDIPFGKF